MNRVRLMYSFQLAKLRAPACVRCSRLLFGGLIGLALSPMGCRQLVPSLQSVPPAVRVARASGADGNQGGMDGKSTSAAEVVKSQQTGAIVPAADSHADGTSPTTPRLLAINLDTVFRLAEDQNSQVALARARVREALAERSIADMSWLPRMDVGTVYYRHEGGIVNPDGTFVHSSFGTFFGGLELTSQLDIRQVVYEKVNAERQLWQQKGELRRVTSDALLDAANTYVDLLAARTGEAIAVSLQKDLQDLLARAQKLAATEPGARVEVARIQTQLKGRDQAVLELHDQAARASVKLAYLLGLDPAVMLLPVDAELLPLDLVDVTPAVADLVARALAVGPGVQEMEALLALIDQSVERAKGPGRFLPVFEVYMDEGIFAAGPGARSDWDNSWNLAVAARWNLTQLLTRSDRERALQAKTEQAHLAYQDLQAKLSAGVYEAREAILSGREQIHITREQIADARRAHKLSYDRLKNNVPGSSASEVLLSLQALSAAQGSYISILRAYDKAQLRLLILLGPWRDGAAAGGNCPMPCVNGQ
jgi:outer membrane protein TolC